MSLALTPASIQYMGFAAALCTTAAFIPQLLRVYRTKSARDISLPTFLLFSVGVLLWLVFGILTRSGPIIFSNSVTIVISVSILLLKVRYDRRPVPRQAPVKGSVL